MTTTENQKLQAQPTARYVLTINATTGYLATTEGECTPERYGVAMAALHGTIPDDTNLLKAAPDLLEALRKVSMNAVYVSNGECSLPFDVVKEVDAAIAKATGAQHDN